MERKYKEQTFENIMKRMLSKIPDNLDKREGSIIYDALAPACAEMTELYIELDNILELAFTETSNGKWLEMRCAEQGIYRKEAVKAQRVGIFNVKVPIESRFSIDNVVYKVIKEIDTTGEDKQYVLECEKAGEIGNTPIGNLLPLNYIDHLESAILSDILVSGTEEESDEALKLRYKQNSEQAPTSGNVFHYMQWAKEVKNVGAARVIPVWDGANTVKVLIVDGDLQQASDEIVNSVQEHIDPNITGLGKGTAPIGCKCTVESALKTPINISAHINGVEVSKVLNIFKSKVELYFKDLIKQKWQSGEEYSASYAKIGALLLECIVEAGGIDYNNLLINDVIANVELNDNVPALGSVVLE